MNNARKLLTTGLIAAVFAAGIASASPAFAFQVGAVVAAGATAAWLCMAVGAMAAAGPMAAGAEVVWAMPATARGWGRGGLGYAGYGGGWGGGWGGDWGYGWDYPYAYGVGWGGGCPCAGGYYGAGYYGADVAGAALGAAALGASGPASATAPVGGRTARARIGTAPDAVEA